MTTNWTRRAPCKSRTLERAPGRLGMIRPLVGAVARPASRHRVSLGLTAIHGWLHEQWQTNADAPSQSRVRPRTLPLRAAS